MQKAFLVYPPRKDFQKQINENRDRKKSSLILLAWFHSHRLTVDFNNGEIPIQVHTSNKYDKDVNGE